jgi:hypothetical protein
MQTPPVLLKFIGKAALNAVGAGLLGDFLVDALPAMAQDAWDYWQRDRSEEDRRAELETMAREAPGELDLDVAAIVAEIAADRPEEVRRAVGMYLTQVPAMIRQTLRRPADPTGTTAPSGWVPRKADELLPLLPTRMPRFRPGDRPLAGVDRELVELLGLGGFGEV